MKLDETLRHASEVRWWLARIREQPQAQRRAYWLRWRAEIAKHRGKSAADRVHDDVVKEWRP